MENWKQRVTSALADHNLGNRATTETLARAHAAEKTYYLEYRLSDSETWHRLVDHNGSNVVLGQNELMIARLVFSAAVRPAKIRFPVAPE